MIYPNEERPTDWFEEIYIQAQKSGKDVPWSHLQTHPHFESWLGQHPLQGQGKQALVVGCGMGDDAIELEKHGFKVTAFDVSPTAIQCCQNRFPDSQVQFVEADLFAENTQWQQQFDFVLEIFTVQALPPKYEDEVIKKITHFVAPLGQLLVIAIVSEQPRDFKQGPPWPLTPEHGSYFEGHGFQRLDCIQAEREKGGKVYTTTFQRHQQ